MDTANQSRFEQLVLRHLDAAHNLARYLTGNDADADDVVQEAFLRALRHFHTFSGEDARAWLFVIIRHASYDLLRQQSRGRFVAIDDVPETVSAMSVESPSVAIDQRLDWSRVEQAMQSLPVEFREVIVLREVEGLSYAAIGEITGIAAGTVMSRLSRARKRLHVLLAPSRSASSDREVH
ncbi:MAG: sigma-70 family RNA polymerase sigma factor [Gemmatimonas sp.]